MNKLGKNEALLHIMNQIIKGAWDQSLVLTLIAILIAYFA